MELKTYTPVEPKFVFDFMMSRANAQGSVKIRLEHIMATNEKEGAANVLSKLNYL